MKNIGNVAAFVVGVLVSVIVMGLLAATMWRTVQFGEWLGVSIPGILALTAGQLALLVIPALFGYQETARGEGGPLSWLTGMVVANAIVGIGSASVQFREVFASAQTWDAQLAAAVVHAALPGVAALAVALVVSLAGQRAVAGRRVASLNESPDA